MDDTDDKPRRNLLLVSAFVLLTIALQLPIEVIVDRLFGTGQHAVVVSSTRAWLVVMLLLAYFSLRFRFAEATLKASKSLREEVRSVTKERVTQLVRQCVTEFPLTRRSRKVIDPALQDRINSLVTRYEADGRRTVLKVSLTLLTFEASPRLTGGPVAAGISLKLADGGHQGMGDEKFYCNLSRAHRLRIQVVTALQLLVYSRGGIELGLPIILASLASLGVAWNIFATL